MTVKKIKRTPAKHAVLQILYIMTGIKLTADVEKRFIIHRFLLLNPHATMATTIVKPAINR